MRPLLKAGLCLVASTSLAAVLRRNLSPNSHAKSSRLKAEIRTHHSSCSPALYMARLGWRSSCKDFLDASSTRLKALLMPIAFWYMYIYIYTGLALYCLTCIYVCMPACMHAYMIYVYAYVYVYVCVCISIHAVFWEGFEEAT